MVISKKHIAVIANVYSLDTGAFITDRMTINCSDNLLSIFNGKDNHEFVFSASIETIFVDEALKSSVIPPENEVG